MRLLYEEQGLAKGSEMSITKEQKQMADFVKKGLALPASEKKRVVDAMSVIRKNRLQPNKTQVKVLFDVYNKHISDRLTDTECPGCVAAVTEYWKKMTKKWN